MQRYPDGLDITVSKVLLIARACSVIELRYIISFLCRLKVPVVSASNVAAARDNEDYEAKNARLGRPQSPHLTIYRLQLTSVLSLTHRATGIALGSIVTVWGIGKV